MSSTSYKLSLFVALNAFIFCMRCSVNPLSSQALQGNWTMLTFTDKEQNVTAIPGEPIEMGNGATLTIDAFLDFPQILFGTGSNENIVLVITTRTTIPGIGTDRNRERYDGTYSITGSTLTIAIFSIGEETGETKIFRITRTGLRLTLEDDERQITWGKIN